MNSDVNKFQTFVGFVALAILGYVIYLFGSWVYHQFVPVPSISLAMHAWFEPAVSSGTPQLHVAGDVLEQGKVATQDRLRLSVEDLTKGNRQSVFLDLKNGHFDSGEQLAFRSFLPEDRLHIRAEYRKAGTSITEDVYLGVQIPFLTIPAALTILGVFGLGFLGFLWLFTGPPLPGKNTGAIMISYVIMLVFLAVPLALPSLISIMSPEMVAAMRYAPVGVLVADPGKGDLGRQWVLNIGGAVDQVAISPPPPNEAKSAAPQGQTPAGTSAAQAGEAVPASAAVAPPSTSAARSDSVKQIDPIVQIQGGLVIPLYVLILSLIGGAINMTLKLPDFQREATSLDIGRAAAGAISATSKAVSAAVKTLQKATREQMPQGAPKTPPVSQAEDATSSQAPTDPTPPASQTKDATTSEAPIELAPPAGRAESSTISQRPIAATETPEQLLLRQTSEWRKGLITQHMYLLSAPFLAIAVYYLLAWLDLLKQPALVLVSFSVGLISDKIVGRITGVASGIVDASRSASDTGTTAK